jgi:CubicO group peptidase (beta-lactamase class C family)
VESLIDFFRGEALEFSPGESYQYSNSNYILLGAVIERVSGIPYGKFLESAILNPLEVEGSGMDNTHEILKDRAAGYQIQGPVLVNAPYLHMSNAYATGGMYSTIGDLYTFDQALYGDLLLDRENQEMMYAPQFAADGSGGSYGLGWQLGKNEDHRRVGHAGSINGFRVFLGRYLDDSVTIILLSNIETEDIVSIIGGLEQIIFNGE